MIDTNQPSALVSAFRVETEKDSISPEQKICKRCSWFSRKYYTSVMRIKEFYGDNVDRSFTGILSDLQGVKNEFYTF